eukprot:2586660-Rhodomonas_salina.6
MNLSACDVRCARCNVRFERVRLGPDGWEQADGSLTALPMLQNIETKLEEHLCVIPPAHSEPIRHPPAFASNLNPFSIPCIHSNPPSFPSDPSAFIIVCINTIPRTPSRAVVSSRSCLLHDVFSSCDVTHTQRRRSVDGTCCAVGAGRRSRTCRRRRWRARRSSRRRTVARRCARRRWPSRRKSRSDRHPHARIAEHVLA